MFGDQIKDFHCDCHFIVIVITNLWYFRKLKTPVHGFHIRKCLLIILYGALFTNKRALMRCLYSLGWYFL